MHSYPRIFQTLALLLSFVYLTAMQNKESTATKSLSTNITKESVNETLRRLIKDNNKIIKSPKEQAAMIKKLVDQDCLSPHFKVDKLGKSLFYLAIKTHDEELIDWLFEKNATIDELKLEITEEDLFNFAMQHSPRLAFEILTNNSEATISINNECIEYGQSLLGGNVVSLKNDRPQNKIADCSYSILTSLLEKGLDPNFIFGNETRCSFLFFALITDEYFSKIQGINEPRLVAKLLQKGSNFSLPLFSSCITKEVLPDYIEKSLASDAHNSSNLMKLHRNVAQLIGINNQSKDSSLRVIEPG